MSRALLLLVLGGLLSSTVAGAGPVRIDGRVVDQSGLALPGATVRLSPIANGQSQSMVTGTDGQFAFDVDAAAYRLDVSLDGFSPASQDIRVTAATRLPDIVLALAHFAEATTVVAAPARTEVQPRRFAAPSTISEKVIENAPLRTNRYVDLLPLLPNVVRGPDGLVSVAGARAPQGVVLLNGVPEIDVATGEPVAQVPLAAVESVQAFTSGFPAEYGQSTGGVTIVNTLAGSDAWKFSVNSVDPRPRLDRNGFHGIEAWEPNVGLRGPLSRGRAWFAQSVDYRFERTRVQTVTGDDDRRVHSLTSLTQIDAKPREAHVLTGWLNVQDERVEGATLSAFTPIESVPTRDATTWGGAIVDRATLGEASTLETRVGLQRQELSLIPAGVAPYVVRHDVTRGSYFDSLDRRAFSVQASSVFSRAWSAGAGSHLVKAGVSAARATLDGTSRARPVAYLRSDGQLARVVQFSGDGRFSADAIELGAFVQDTWTLSDRLIADVGVRADRGTRVGTILAPRVGVTLKLDEPTTITAGVGLFSDKTPLAALAFPGYQSRVVTLFDRDGTAIDTPVVRRNVLSDSLGRARAWRWETRVDRRLGGNWQVRVGYQERSGSRELVVLPTADAAGLPVALLATAGTSRWRSFETTFGFHPSSGRHQLYVSYVRSSARGSTNDFNQVDGTFRDPLLEAAAEAPLPTDVPHRVLAWGVFSLPWRATIAPFVEIRSGFPFSAVADDWGYVGQRLGRRYPAFGSLDIVVNKMVDLPRGLLARVGFKVYNLAGRGAGRDIQRDVERADYGRTYNAIGRQLRGVFEIVWNRQK